MFNDNTKLWQEIADTQKLVSDLSMVVMEIQRERKEERAELIDMIMDAHRKISKIT